MKRCLSTLVALTALILLPAASFSLELFEGNLGYDGEWLSVLDSTSMSDRVYWYELGDDVTYQAQIATNGSFLDLVLDLGDIDTNYVEPGLGPGFYYFRVREIHSSGAVGSWSNTGTLEVMEDRELPTAEILSPLPGQSFERGDLVSVQLRISDDTVLRLARFTIGGEYAGTLGLKTENYKVSPSFGEPRTVVFDYRLPKNTGKGPLEISVVVTDVTDKAVADSVVIDIGGSLNQSSSTEKPGNHGGRRSKR
jgi:hypothetical protein